MRRFSSSLYRLFHFARDHRGVRYLITVLGLLAFVAIGAAAGAHEWRAPSAEEPRLSPIELRTDTPASERKASERKAKVVKTTKKLTVRRPERRKARSVSPSSRRGAPPVLGPAPAPAGSGDDDDDAEGGEGGEGNDGDDVTDGGDD